LAPSISHATHTTGLEPHGPRVLWSSLALGIIATLVSLTGSWIPSLWGDEATSIMSAQRSLPSLFMMLGNVDAVHGTYYFLLHFWVQLFGTSAFSVRLPSAFAVGITTLAVVLIADRLGGPRFAIVAGVLFTVLPRTTYMGAEARSYAFSAALVAWLSLLLIELIRTGGRPRALWVAYCAVLAVGIYFFLYVALFVLVHGIVLISDRGRRRLMRRWAVAAVVALTAAAPVAVFAYRERAQVAYLGENNETSISTLVQQLWFGDRLSAAIGWGLIGFALLSGIIAFAKRALTFGRVGRVPTRGDRDVLGDAPSSTRLPSAVWLGTLWLFVPAGVLVGAIPIFAGFTARYLSDGAPAAALLMASGLMWCLNLVPELRIRAVLTGVVTFAIVAGMVPSYLAQRGPYSQNESDWAELSDTLQDNAERGDAVVFDESQRPSRDPRLAMHAYPDGFAGLDDVTLKTPYYDNTFWRDVAYTVPAAARLGRFDGVHRIWLIEYSSGGETDDYGMSTLRSLGYAVKATLTTHREVVYELVS
jgi:mannosyltransferase